VQVLQCHPKACFFEAAAAWDSGGGGCGFVMVEVRVGSVKRNSRQGLMRRNSIQFDSIRFDSILFSAIRYDSQRSPRVFTSQGHPRLRPHPSPATVSDSFDGFVSALILFCMTDFISFSMNRSDYQRPRPKLQWLLF
jgi:hypothetical protein